MGIEIEAVTRDPTVQITGVHDYTAAAVWAIEHQEIRCVFAGFRRLVIHCGTHPFCLNLDFVFLFSHTSDKVLYLSHNAIYLVLDGGLD